MNAKWRAQTSDLKKALLGLTRTSELKKALLALGLLEGNEESCADGKYECTVDGSDVGPEEGTLLELGLLEGDEE
jgi:hypothetical protein